MRNVLRANKYFLIILILEVFMPIPLSFIYKILGITDIKLMLALNHFMLFIVPAIIYVLVTKCNVKETFRFKKLPIKDFFLVILLGIGCLFITNFFGLISGFIFENNIGEFITSINSSPYIILLLLVAVMPSITEEITLRGVILSGYNEKSKFKAALVSGLFFGMFHLDFQQFVYATVLGFILAYTVRVTGSIFSSMIIHFIINGTSITLNKLMQVVSPASLDSAADVSLKNLAINEKITLAIGGLFWLAIGILIAVFVLRKLQRLSDIRNGIVKEIVYDEDSVFTLRDEKVNIEDNRMLRKETSRERIIDWPFVLSIVFYLIIMIVIPFIIRKIV
ncbi:MAG: lysostaphin resistance A-like protein [Clostridium chrysemydis]|uniref:CPBP family intramembrane glutamic endopeptidase n=1 Tax=Clostridium TaxID=1485 RepID=UPI0021523DD1|nr:type II CAAX endopeptidase family protein [Clostridium sp. LY3-2]MCR6516225.1 CPBP family intramembrane metalloprotease [Clostridium sp. LY3-2]